MSEHRRTRLIAGTGVSLGAAFTLGGSAEAATLEVDNTGDNGALQACTAAAGDCSLHGALLVSNASTTVTDTVTFASTLSGSTIMLAGQKNIYDAVNIQGPGAASVAISGNDLVRIFNLNPPAGEAVVISGLTLRDGRAPINDLGGAIENIDSALQISNVEVTSSQASAGGGIYLRDDHNNGFSTFIRNSTISGNLGLSGAGGIEAEGSIGYLINSTVSGNHAMTSLAAGGVQASGFSYFYDSTIAGNTAGVGVGGVSGSGLGPDGVMFNTIVANNTGPQDDLAGTFDGTFTLVEDLDGGVLNSTAAGGNIVGVDPQLGPLAANGGPTPTHRPATTSPVVDKGRSAQLTDQRGRARPFDAPSIANPGGAGVDGDDIGAVELQAEDFPIATPATPAKKCKKKKGKKKKCKKKKKKK